MSARKFLEDLNEKTQYLVESLNEYIEAKDYSVRLFHIGSIYWISFSKEHHVNSADKINSARMEYFKKFHNFLLEHGVF
ncbi:MAG: hypothetical protein R2728_05705 [Chitinophagales bacterium]